MSLVFEPLFSWQILAALGGLAIILAAIGLYHRKRGMVLRSLALAFGLLALANPAILSEDRESLPTEVAIVVDRSQSQDNAGRTEQTDKILAGLKDNLGRYKNIHARVIETERDLQTDSPSTAIFSALANGLDNVASSRVGGVIVITDGQVHDVPKSGKPAGIDAPVHTLLTGRDNEFDRRIEIIKAPRFGLVGKEQEITFRVIDDGPSPAGPARVTIRVNGEDQGTLDTDPGTEQRFMLNVPRAGENVVELAVTPVDGEITLINNRMVSLVEGIRENLRVLLVSGEPHAGERAWRNLLKSDASVDLVHFTILRPPEKQDGTPINELSLIAFPTQELFVDKIKDFDLIIFDRYQHRGVLPLLYYDNIAQYVRQGGALLLVTGPEHAGPDSIAMTPLSNVLPAMPTGEMINKPFYPRLSDLGRKHPVTRDLAGSQTEPPGWGRWFRTVGVTNETGNTLMVGADQSPLLVLNRVDEGRVAMLLSDQGWLWARGLEGGGPHVDLYRRIAHWLMKEPGLEEEALTARSIGKTIEIRRQTIGDDPGPATIRHPSGDVTQQPLVAIGPGLWQARIDTQETGLFEISNGDLKTLVHSGAVDAPEFRETISSARAMQPVADITGGIVHRAISGDHIDIPQILPLSGATKVIDPDRMVIRLTSDTILKGVSSLPLFAGLVGLALLLLSVSATWWREGR